MSKTLNAIWWGTVAALTVIAVAAYMMAAMNEQAKETCLLKHSADYCNATII